MDCRDHQAVPESVESRPAPCQQGASRARGVFGLGTAAFDRRFFFLRRIGPCAHWLRERGITSPGTTQEPGERQSRVVTVPPADLFWLGGSDRRLPCESQFSMRARCEPIALGTGAWGSTILLNNLGQVVAAGCQTRFTR
jgi:hypothetical protein